MTDVHLVPDVEPPRQKRPRETKRGGLWVNDKELIERLNVDEAKARAVLRELDTDKTSGFPQKWRLWGDKRYWPAIAAYFEHHYGYKLGDLKTTRSPR